MDSIELIKLTHRDLINRPVWRHWTDETVEYVQASDKNEIGDDNKENYIVLTNFVLNNGLQLVGFCSPQDPSGLDYIQPTVFTDNGQINFWSDNGWTTENKNEQLEKLKLRHESVFPIKYKTTIKCDGNFYEGTIDDFNKGN